LGERKTEDLKVTGSIPVGGIFFSFIAYEVVLRFPVLHVVTVYRTKYVLLCGLIDHMEEQTLFLQHQQYLHHLSQLSAKLLRRGPRLRGSAPRAADDIPHCPVVVGSV
jgi:hypothetical protein